MIRLVRPVSVLVGLSYASFWAAYLADSSSSNDIDGAAAAALPDDAAGAAALLDDAPRVGVGACGVARPDAAYGVA